MSNLNLRISNVGTKYYLEVFGKLNEDTNFNRVDLSSASEIVVSFKNVTQVQSCGVREWIKLIKPLSHIAFTFLNCPKIIIDQINMVDGFLPKNGKIESFYVPYYSEISNSTSHILYRYGADFDYNGLIRFRDIKDNEGNTMELDIIEHRYFRFLNCDTDKNGGFFEMEFNKKLNYPTSA